jgi:hypothetical protein
MQTKQIEHYNTDLILWVLEKCLLKKQEIPKFKFLCIIHLISKILGSKPGSFPKSHDIAQTGDHPWEDLAKFGYRPNMKVEKRKKKDSFYIPSNLLEPVVEIWQFLFFLIFFSFPLKIW